MGQCGYITEGRESRFLSTPTVVDRFREFKTLEVACGGFHTLVLCEIPGSTPRLYGMGLNSSGQVRFICYWFHASICSFLLFLNRLQLGQGHTSAVASPVVIPTQLQDDEHHIVGMTSGCLAMHSFVYTAGVHVSRPTLRAVHLAVIAQGTQRLAQLQRQSPSTASAASGAGVEVASNVGGTAGNADRAIEFESTVALRQLREYVDTAFSSIAVLNASFHLGTAVLGAQSVDLESVRLCYTLLWNTGSAPLAATLGRATLSLTSKLIECPFDDPENLSVFLIVLENPLLLDPDKFHLAIERVISGILALPKQFRNYLFAWFKDYPSEYFCRVLDVRCLSLAYF